MESFDKGVVYAMLRWSMLSLWLRCFRSCCHVYVPEAMVGILTLILILYRCIEYIGHLLDTS